MFVQSCGEWDSLYEEPVRSIGISSRDSVLHSASCFSGSLVSHHKIRVIEGALSFMQDPSSISPPGALRALQPLDSGASH